MIVEVAKWRYLQEHPNRKRSPRGFTDDLSLKLTGIEAGSAVPQISVFFAQRRHGVMAVTVAECGTLALHVEPEPTPFPEQVVIDFSENWHPDCACQEDL